MYLSILVLGWDHVHAECIFSREEWSILTRKYTSCQIYDFLRIIEYYFFFTETLTKDKILRRVYLTLLQFQFIEQKSLLKKEGSWMLVGTYLLTIACKRNLANPLN